MEYVEGHSLGEEVKMHGPIPEIRAIEYVSKIGDALAYIHGLSINHLDVKPNNIMLRQCDNQVILIDFGVAKQYDAETLEGTTTTPVGISHGYSPLEQYKSNGVQEFSPQSDVYSLAATLYKLLTGITPSEAIEIQEDGVDIDELKAKNVSQNTIDAIVAAMKSRKKRTQSVEEFINALGRAQVAEPTQDQINPQQTDAETEKQASTKSYSEEDDNNMQEDEETIVNPHPHIDIDSSISTEEITIKGQGQEHATEEELAFCIKYGLQADVDVPVDMGLSVKWCSNNLLAPSPVSVGGHFAWTMGLSKHIFDKKWHLPSVENFNELKNNCTWKWISEGEIQGYLVTSNTTNNSIFLRCAGKIDDTDIYNKDMGFYWSDCISTTPGNAYYLTIMQCCILCYQQNPCKVGRSVRLVCK
jgi:serine/threonine protein kinase